MFSMNLFPQKSKRAPRGRREALLCQGGLLAAGLVDHEVVPGQLALERIRGDVGPDVVLRGPHLELGGSAGVVAEIATVVLQGARDGQGVTGESASDEIDAAVDADPGALGAPAVLVLLADHRVDEASRP